MKRSLMQILLETSRIGPEIFQRVVELVPKYSSKEVPYISKLSCFFQLTVLSAAHNLNFPCYDSPSILQKLFKYLLLNLSRRSFLLP